MAQVFKGPLDQAQDLLKARRETLNKRINYKGNYENYITGGSKALNNQSHLDSNDYVKGMTTPGNGWDKDPWTQGLNDKYTNPEHNRRAGNAPYGSDLNYIHDQTPSTKRGRRVADIYFHKKKVDPYGTAEDGTTWDQIQKIVDKYERIK